MAYVQQHPAFPNLETNQQTFELVLEFFFCLTFPLVKENIVNITNSMIMHATILWSQWIKVDGEKKIFKKSKCLDTRIHVAHVMKLVGIIAFRKGVR